MYVNISPIIFGFNIRSGCPRFGGPDGQERVRRAIRADMCGGLALLRNVSIAKGQETQAFFLKTNLYIFSLISQGCKCANPDGTAVKPCV